MTEAEYSALTEACDQLLDSSSGPDRIAVSWLHILNEHPSNLQRYSELIDPAKALQSLRLYLRNLAVDARTVCRAVQAGPEVSLEKGKSLDRMDVLFVSHLVSAEADPEGPDFYFGDLPRELASRGLKTLMALQNQVPDAAEWLGRRFGRAGGMARLVMPMHLKVGAEVVIMRRAHRAATELRRQAVAMRGTFRGAVALGAARHAAGASTRASLRLHCVIMSLCRRFRPRAVIVLWEGHAWERMVLHAARSVDPGVRCIGYQHTILFPRAHALRRPLGGSFDPDHILTLGDVNRDVLQASPGMRNVSVATYGSHRRAVTPLPRAAGAWSRCLVMPEGIELECVVLFDFVLRAAVSLPDTEFVLRMHPVLPFERFLRRHPRFRVLPPNVAVSRNADIALDFSRCDWTLYRGSSAAVHAVLAGVRPVYLVIPGELSIDPLFALQGWRRHIESVEDLAALQAADRLAAAGSRVSEWEPARTFCDRYVTLPRPDVVAQLVAA